MSRAAIPEERGSLTDLLSWDRRKLGHAALWPRHAKAVHSRPNAALGFSVSFAACSLVSSMGLQHWPHFIHCETLADCCHAVASILAATAAMAATFSWPGHWSAPKLIHHLVHQRISLAGPVRRQLPRLRLSCMDWTPPARSEMKWPSARVTAWSAGQCLDDCFLMIENLPDSTKIPQQCWSQPMKWVLCDPNITTKSTCKKSPAI